MDQRKKIFSVAFVLAIVFVLIAIYYIIPGYPHFLVFSTSNASHPTHFIVFIGLAIISAGAAIIYRPKTQKTE